MRKLKKLKELFKLTLLEKRNLLQLIRDQERMIQLQNLTIKSLQQQINRGA